MSTPLTRLAATLVLVACWQAAGCAGEVSPGMLDAAVRDQQAADGGTREGGRSSSSPDSHSPTDTVLETSSPADSAPQASDASSSGGGGGAYPGKQTRTVGSGSAAMTYHLYLPKAYTPSKPWPLLSVFHGQGDSGANMRDFWATVAESHAFIVIATTSTGTSGGWSGAKDIPRYEVAFNDALSAYNIDRARLYIWGFSAGAHFVHAIALMNADLFAAYAVNAGVLAAFAGPSAPAAALRKIPISIRIGDGDPMVGQARQDRSRFKAAGWIEGTNLTYSEFSGGHQLPPGDRQRAWDFLSSRRLP